MLSHKGSKDGLGNPGFSIPETHRSSLSCCYHSSVPQTLRTTKEGTWDGAQTLLRANLYLSPHLFCPLDSEALLDLSL